MNPNYSNKPTAINALVAASLLFNVFCFGQSLNLTESIQYVNIGDLDISGSSITVEAKILLTNPTGNIVSKHTDPSNVNYLLRPTTFEITTNNGFYLMQNPFTLELNRWYHVAGTYDGQYIRYYVNGCLIIENPASGQLFQNNLDVGIGNRSLYFQDIEQFYGQIDEVRIWNVCRSENEIKASMNNLPNPESYNGLMAYYKFDNDLLNLASNTNNGVPVGSIQFAPESSEINTFEYLGYNILNSNCDNYDIEILASGSDLEYSLDGSNYVLNNLLSLNPGQQTVWLRTQEGCVITTDINLPLEISPTFTQVADICNGEVLNPLPTTSNNGVTGIWSPALDNTATTTYTFTPDLGQCATTATMTITVNPNIIPTFTQVADICSGDTLAALPTISENGYTGNWTPALDNTATTNYTFTPTSGQCTTTATMTITVNPNIIPTFTQVAAICNGELLNPLPTTSNNGVTGIWSPDLNNTATTTYTFTPDAGQCATTTTMTIIVSACADSCLGISGNILINPSFEIPEQVNIGNNFTSWPINGWNGFGAIPNIVKTNGVLSTGGPNIAHEGTQYLDIVGGIGGSSADFYQEFEFQCNVRVYFSGYFSVRDNRVSTGRIDILRVNSNNTTTLVSSSIPLNMPPTPNIWYLTTGTALLQPGLYRFNITMGDYSNFDDACFSFDYPNVNTGTYEPLCENSSSITLTGTPTDSNGIWSGSGITDNGDGTASFDPSGLGGNIVPVTYSNYNTLGFGCSQSTNITVNSSITSSFTQVSDICSGEFLLELPTTSNNGVTGTWSPVLDNTTTTTYTFTPAADQCATTATMTITVNPNIIPTFTQVAAICNGELLNPLPTTSNNGVTGIWSPALNNTVTTTYTFTPDTSQCATTTTMIVEVTVAEPPVGNAVQAGCDGATVGNNNIFFTGENLQWYSDATGGSPLSDDFPLEDGAFYYISQTVDGCESSRLAFQYLAPEPIIIVADTTICEGESTTVTATSSPFLGSATFLWNTGETTESISLSPTVTTGYWVDQVYNSGGTPNLQTLCRYFFTITVESQSPPTGESTQIFCEGSTIADLSATGNNIQWYDSAISGNLLDATTVLTDGQIVYASQTVNSCESVSRLEVTVSIPDIQIMATTTEICAGEKVELSLNTMVPSVCNMDITLTDVPFGDEIPGFTYAGFYNEHHYYVHNTPTSWTEGEQICRENGGYLVCINSEEENTFVSNLTDNNIWIGLFRDPDNCEFRWLDCIDITYTNWRPGEPNSGPCGEPYAQIIRGCTFGYNTWNNLSDNASNGSCYSNMVPIMEIDPSIYNSSIDLNATYVWSTGETIEVISVEPTETTEYWVDVTTNGVTCRETITITVNSNVVPSFTQVPAICSGETLNVLPITSNNGITGTWSPALDNTATTTYTFTPDAGQCATTASMIITVNPNIAPTFTQVADICSGETLNVLPTTSNNGITGTWSPALDNTATTTYTFTPTAGQCATTTTMTITVNPNIAPTFTQVADICSGDTLAALPTTSDNGYTGTWSPALDNTATTTYTFTPTAGQCATTTTMTITVNPNITPTFTQVDDICSGGYISCVTDYIGKWLYRNLVTSIRQYVNNDLHVYANCWSVCNHYKYDYNSKSKHNTNFYTSGRYLFRRYISCVTHYIGKWLYRNLVTSIRQYGNNNLYVYTRLRAMCNHCKYDN